MNRRPGPSRDRPELSRKQKHWSKAGKWVRIRSFPSGPLFQMQRILCWNRLQAIFGWGTDAGLMTVYEYKYCLS
jgi:hypothetical protein